MIPAYTSIIEQDMRNQDQIAEKQTLTYGNYFFFVLCITALIQ